MPFAASNAQLAIDTYCKSPKNGILTCSTGRCWWENLSSQWSSKVVQRICRLLIDIPVKRENEKICGHDKMITIHKSFTSFFRHSPATNPDHSSWTGDLESFRWRRSLRARRPAGSDHPWSGVDATLPWPISDGVHDLCIIL